MGSGKRVYVTGQDVICRLTVLDGHDQGRPVVAMGEGRYSIDRDHLDAVDLNPDRPMTQEEQADFDAKKQAELDAQAEAPAPEPEPERASRSRRGSASEQTG